MPRENRPDEVVTSFGSVADSRRPPTVSTRSSAIAQSSRLRATRLVFHTTTTSTSWASIIAIARSTWRRFQNRPERSRSVITSASSYPLRAQWSRIAVSCSSGEIMSSRSFDTRM